MASLNKTPLFDYHFEVGAKMVPVGNWTMPMQFGDGARAEFMHSFEGSCITDMGCCNIYRLIGNNFKKALAFAGDTAVGKGAFCRWYRDGKVVDTPFAVRMDEEDILCAFAPSAKNICMEYFDSDELQDLTEIFGCIALWGETFTGTLEALGVDTDDFECGMIKRIEIDNVRCIAVMTEVFEDICGVMLFCDREKMDDVWIALFNTPGVWAAGFGAWDMGRMTELCVPFNTINSPQELSLFEWQGSNIPQSGEKLVIDGKENEIHTQVIYSAQLPHTDEALLLVGGDFAHDTVVKKAGNDPNSGVWRRSSAAKV